VGDWLDELEGDDRKAWDDFVDRARRDALEKIDSSAFVMSLVPRGPADIKFAVELGLSIMLDKPIVAVVMPGAEVPDKLRAVADEIVEADVDLEEGRRKVHEAIDRRMRALGE
jgi:hypothetical protein